MNRTVLIGRLTNDPELRANTDNKVAKFTLAVNRLKEGTDFINCVAWNKQAELISKYFKKGSQMALEGRIQTGSYEKDGIKRYTTDVVVESLTFLGNSEKKEESSTDDVFNSTKSIKSDEIELSEDDYPF